jgi:hypothetical protein
MSSGFAMTTQTIRFYHRGTVREHPDVPATRTLLRHLRAVLHCCGGKHGHARQDRNASPVMSGEPDDAGRASLNAVNTIHACRQFLLPTPAIRPLPIAADQAQQLHAKAAPEAILGAFDAPAQPPLDPAMSEPGCIDTPYSPARRTTGCIPG